MVKSITINNYKRFNKSIKLDFSNYKSKTKGKDFIISNISSVAGILGKNASGKSTIVNAISFYANFTSNSFYSTGRELLYISKINELMDKRSKESIGIEERKIIDKKVEKMTKLNIEKSKNFDEESLREKVNNLFLKRYEKAVNDKDKPVSFTVEYYGNDKLVTHKLKIYSNNVYEAVFLNGKEIYNQEKPIHLFKSLLLIKLEEEGIESTQLDIAKRVLDYDNESLGLKIESYVKEQPNLFYKFLKIVDETIHSFVFDKKGIPTSYVSKENKKPLSFSSLSDGTLFFVNLYQSIHSALFRRKTFLIIDEIENSLHFALIKFIITIFKKRYNKFNSQLLFTTHSPYVFDSDFKSNSIYFIDGNEVIRNEERYDKKIAPGYLRGELISNPNYKYRFIFLEEIIEYDKKN